MTVETVKYEMNVPKEGKDVVDLIDQVIVRLRDGAQVEDAIALFAPLREALDGIDKLSEEGNSEYRDELAGYLVHKLMERLMPVSKR